MWEDHGNVYMGQTYKRLHHACPFEPVSQSSNHRRRRGRFRFNGKLMFRIMIIVIVDDDL